MNQSIAKKSIRLMLATSLVLITYTGFANEPSQSGVGVPPSPGNGQMPQGPQQSAKGKPKGSGQQEYYQVKMENILISGKKHGEEGGSPPQDGTTNNVISPRDLATGQSSGKRQHAPIKLNETGGSPNSPETEGSAVEASDYLSPGEAEGFNPQPEPPGNTIKSPRDVATGQSSGKRQHAPIKLNETGGSPNSPETEGGTAEASDYLSPGEAEGFNPQPEPPGNVKSPRDVATGQSSGKRQHGFIKLNETGGSPNSLKTGGSTQEASDYLHPGGPQGLNPQPEPPGKGNTPVMPNVSGYSVKSTGGALPGGLNQGPQPHMNVGQPGLSQNQHKFDTLGGTPSPKGLVSPDSIVGPNSTPNNMGIIAPQNMPGTHGIISPNQKPAPLSSLQGVNGPIQKPTPTIKLGGSSDRMQKMTNVQSNISKKMHDTQSSIIQNMK
jgi:hypothetical protein